MQLQFISVGRDLLIHSVAVFVPVYDAWFALLEYPGLRLFIRILTI